MEFKDSLIICILVTFSGVVVTQKQEFCQSFADNNFAIDYSYDTDLWSHHFLFIGTNYWKIEWSGDTVRLKSSLSRTSDWLGKQFRTTFLTNFGEGVGIGHLMSGRLYKVNNTIDWVSIEFDKTSGQLDPNGDNDVIRTEIGFEPDFSPSVSLVASYETICFLKQNPVKNGTSIVFEMTYHCFRFDYLTENAENVDKEVIQDLKTQMDRRNISYGADQTILKNLRHGRQVIAILSELHFSGFRYLFLFKDNKTITHCLINFVDFNKECESEPEVLINCSDYEKQRTEMSSSTSLRMTEAIVGLVVREGSVGNTHLLPPKYVEAFICAATVLIVVLILKRITKPKTQNPPDLELN